MKVFVVINVEVGWDCVRGVYQAKSEEQLKEYLIEKWELPEDFDWGDCPYIIHEKQLEKVNIS